MTSDIDLSTAKPGDMCQLANGSMASFHGLRHDDDIRAYPKCRYVVGGMFYQQDGTHGGENDSLKVVAIGKFIRRAAPPVPDIRSPQQPGVVPVVPAFGTWQDIATAPKTGDNYVALDFLAWCPDELRHEDGEKGDVRLCWWEPKMIARNGNEGMWYGDGEFELFPTLWMPKPPAPAPSAPPAADAPAEVFNARTATVDGKADVWPDMLTFLQMAGRGCISGAVADWPQLKPACKWAAEQIAKLNAIPDAPAGADVVETFMERRSAPSAIKRLQNVPVSGDMQIVINDYESLAVEFAKLTAERDAALEAVDKNWVTHQQIAAAMNVQTENARLKIDLGAMTTKCDAATKKIAELKEVWLACDQTVMCAVCGYVDWDSEKSHSDECPVGCMANQIKALTADRDKLAAFKAYVHKRLDDAGVPADPDSPHKAEGCRIGGRLDWVFDYSYEREIAELKAKLAALTASDVALREALEELQDAPPRLELMADWNDHVYPTLRNSRGELLKDDSDEVQVCLRKWAAAIRAALASAAATVQVAGEDGPVGRVAVERLRKFTTDLEAGNVSGYKTTVRTLAELAAENPPKPMTPERVREIVGDPCGSVTMGPKPVAFPTDFAKGLSAAYAEARSPASTPAHPQCGESVDATVPEVELGAVSKSKGGTEIEDSVVAPMLRIIADRLADPNERHRAAVTIVEALLATQEVEQC
jgi:hypothetical protein